MNPDKNEQNLAAAFAIAERLPGVVNQISRKVDELDQEFYAAGDTDEKWRLLDQVLELVKQGDHAAVLIDSSRIIISYFPPENPHWLS